MTASMSISIPRLSEPPTVVTWITHPRVQVVFSILALCLIVLFNVFFYVFSPYDGMQVFKEDPFGEVAIVYPAGPAALAGILVGDQLLAVEGRPLDSRASMPQYRPGIRPGDVLQYEIRRGSQAFSVELTIGSNRDNLPLLGSQLGLQVLSLGLWIIGLLLTLFAVPHDTRARLLSLGFFLAGITAAVGGVSGWNSFWGATTIQLVLWSFLVPVIIAAHLTFPAMSFQAFRGRIIYLVLTISMLLVVLAVLEGWLMAHRAVSLETWIGIDLRRMVLAWFLLAWVGAIGLLLRNRFLSADPENRRQTGIILWGMTLGLGPFSALTLLPYLVFGTEYVPGFYTILFLLLLPLAYAYVIFQRRLLRVDFIINRLVVFFVQVLLILMVFMLLFGVALRTFNLPAELALLAGLLAAVIALASSPMQKLVQRQVNKVLYGSHYDFSTVTASLSNQLARTLDRERLVGLLTANLGQQMGISQAALLLLDGEQLRLQMATNSEFSVNAEDELCAFLGENRKPMRAHKLWNLVSANTRARWETCHWGRLFVPLIFEGRLHGILILGARVGGDVYGDQDLQIIATVAYQGALAAANVILVEDLQGLARQLVRSDEDQRKRLARDLHDEVLQDLFFIKQRLPRDQNYTELGSHLESLIQKLRRLIKTQRPALLNQGIVLALSGLVGEMGRLTGPSTKLTWQSDLEEWLELTDEQATSVFRIAQEALNNALKHAAARNIEVKLERRRDVGLRLIIEDDGVGFGGGEASLSPQYGLLGMRERARMIDASLEVKARTEGGTTVVLEFLP